MAYETILYEERDHILDLTFNRPEKLNAMNDTLLEEFADAVDAFEADDNLWVAIISGAGRSFCAGRDVQDYRERLDTEVDAPRRVVGPPFLDPIKSGKPVIGAVQGHAYGFGLWLTGECSVVVAAEDARFAMSMIRRSIPGGGIWSNITQWIPSKIATEMAITGEPIDAKTAHHFGLVNQVVSNEKLLESANAIAERILLQPPLAVRATMQAIRNNARHDIAERQSRNPQPSLGDTDDYREAITSFVEKRDPVFKGR
ncbi:enoyl-CoA hydratase/isomerase family protein [Dehalococcoidia bacterium]|nr:enoyl-CoA hydratase/isomerase family protein [Dehalococcoidia bacterium]